MNVIGINAFHADSAACLFVDGQLIAAAEEERFRRLKHWAGFPSESIRYCLLEGGLSLSDIEVIGINSEPRAALGKKISYALSGKAGWSLIKEKIRTRKKRGDIPAYLSSSFPGETFGGQVEAVEHHLAHLASAFYVSPFEEAAVVSVDGFGDFSSSAWGFGQGSSIVETQRVYFPHSLGIFYQAMTQFLGFPHYGDEYKVMGLAPYGEPGFSNDLDQVLVLLPDGRFNLNLDYFRHQNEPMGYDWDDGVPMVSDVFSARLEELMGPRRSIKEPLEQRHMDIARSVQAAYEQAFFNILQAAHNETPTGAVAIAGGCGANSVANGKIHSHTPFTEVYVQSAAGDAGGAIGAALIAGERHGEGVRKTQMDHAYWGPGSDNNQIGALVGEAREKLEQQSCGVALETNEKRLLEGVVAQLCAGGVVGWFQGRMEWGPRALGNRSILGDPRREDMKDILNLKIKRRESFRPFAPSILREHVSEWFDSDADVPFMMKVFQVREEKRAEIPAVTHADGSGRLQTVTEEQNGRYYRLINTFFEATGVPMLLNTSFNENEPVVCTPAEALDCFLRTNMDMLVLGDHIIERRQTGA